ncbi:MAG TPA: hypothetical protein DDW50_22020 [Firmicutes bacterium]|jgi:hypothetical protein|nr:hypothetical protein [Bacillota bacterium]
MFKFKFYLWNILASCLIGLAVCAAWLFEWGCCHSFYQLFYGWTHHTSEILLWAFFCMGVGAAIGTISLFFFFQVFLRLTQRPWAGYLTNFSAVAVLNIIGAIMMGIRTYRDFINSVWLIALIVSEILTFFLTFSLYRRIMVYKQKLEEKKAFLKRQELK